MWSKVVRKGDKWRSMTAQVQISKLVGMANVPMLLSLITMLPGDCPK
jgi:hypothetical protein